MNDQARYFGMSAVLHGFLAMLLVGLAALAAKSPRTVTIDFSLNESPPLCATEQQKTSQQPVPRRSRAAQDTPRPVVLPPQQPVPAVAGVPARVEPPAKTVAAADQQSQQQTEQRREAPSASVAQTPIVTGVRPVEPSSGGYQTVENNVEQIRKKYLKEHFNYIRDLIVKRLDYPPIARRMGWSGKVVVVFVVAENGDVRSINVKESSGYPLLDKSAVDTVKRVAPFPRPPVSAEIVIPVQFRLE